MLSPEAARDAAVSLVDRACKAGADAADAVYIGDRSQSVQVRMGALEAVSSAEGEEIGLRVFRGHRSATVAASTLDAASLDALVERALAMAGEAPEDPFAGLAPPGLLLRDAPPGLDLDDPTQVATG